MVSIIHWSLAAVLTAFSPADNEADYNHQSYYDIIKNEKVIGYMKCSKLGNGEITEYINESSANFSIIINVSVYSRLQSSFRNGILQNGKLIRRVNGKTKSDKHITRNNDEYVISNDGKSASLKSSINFSTACLMYTEPSGINHIFSENFGKYVELKETSPHTYVLKLPDGNNVYTYRNGICVEVEVQTSLATVYIKPRT